MRNGGGATATSVRLESDHLVVICEPGSHGEQNADALLQYAEQTLAQILRRLKLSGEVLSRPRKIVIHAQDAIHDPQRPGQLLTVGTSSDLTSDVIYTVYRPQSPAVGLVEHLCRVVLQRVGAGVQVQDDRSEAKTGTAEAQRFLIEGVARYLAHGLARRALGGVGQPKRSSEQACFDWGLANGWRLPVYQSMMRGTGPEVDSAIYAAMQETFGGYLFERDGAKEFLRFLAGARNDPNHSAEIVYGKSLELLEAEWVTILRRGVGRKIISLWEFFPRVWPYLKPYPWRILESLSLIFLSSISTQVTPFQIRNLIDLLGSERAKADPWGYGLEQALWIVAVILVAGLINICAIVRLIYVTNVLGQNILRDLRVAYVDRVNLLGFVYFGRMRSGDLMARFTSDMAHLADPLARTVTYSTYYFVLMCVTLVSLIVMNWELTLLLLLIVPSYFAIGRSLGPRIQRVNRGRQERLAQINSHIGELIYAHPMIKIFNLQDYVRRRMRPEIHEFRRVEIRTDFLRAIFNEVSDIADMISTKLVWVFGSVLVLASYDPPMAAIIGTTTIGTVPAYNTLMGRFVLPIHRLASIYANIAYAAAALRRIEEILRQEPENMATPANGTAEPPAVRDTVAIEGVDFAYGVTPTLQDIDVTIPVGTSAAFVGPTGAGKTTLVNMIPRFYDPASGTVRIDGRDVREHALSALRSRISLVSQETFLFNATVRENIAMGKLDATDEQIVAAAKGARLHDTIMALPAGYDTIVGERGSRLSGGQRQRLSIARALLRDAPILILDEATSALDAETEHEVLEELAEVTQGKTTIIVTHRLALAMRADMIYVLDNGRIVEHGTHAELIAHSGLYKRLFEDQNQFLLKSRADGSVSLAVHRLQAVPLFSMLPSERLEPLARAMSTEQYKPGQVICREGEDADKLYILAQGEVELLAHDPAGVEHRLNVLSGHGVFGDSSLLLDIPRQLTARALTHVTVQVLCKGDVEVFTTTALPVGAAPGGNGPAVQPTAATTEPTA